MGRKWGDSDGKTSRIVIVLSTSHRDLVVPTSPTVSMSSLIGEVASNSRASERTEARKGWAKAPSMFNRWAGSNLSRPRSRSRPSLSVPGYFSRKLHGDRAGTARISRADLLSRCRRSASSGVPRTEKMTFSWLRRLA